ncbi:type II secretion system protein [Spiribacter insolitus]|uniref:Type II secretion system protein n=1 Tax=Spiribacter insolitus TaxID=3122417 RepID=A0ABV3T7G7_9GAMM
MSDMRNRAMRSHYGFTLLEIVVTLIILGIVAAVASTPLITLIQSRDSISMAASEQSDNDYALARMATQIRLSETDGIDRCNATELWIRGDSGPDAAATQYTFTAGQILVSEKILVENVDNPDAGGEKLCDIVDDGLRLYRLAFRVDGELFAVRAFKRDAGPQ